MRDNQISVGTFMGVGHISPPLSVVLVLALTRAWRLAAETEYGHYRTPYVLIISSVAVAARDRIFVCELIKHFSDLALHKCFALMPRLNTRCMHYSCT